ncbi:bacillithiol system redox-active protein YtxJ [Bacillaceae bacterium]
MSEVRELTTLEQLDEFLDGGETKLLFKHSITCPISAEAYDHFLAFAREHGEYEYGLVKVQEARPVSNAIAERLAIKHESPQIFLLEGNEVVWHASHWDITKDAIEKATGRLR